MAYKGKNFFINDIISSNEKTLDIYYKSHQ